MIPFLVVGDVVLYLEFWKGYGDGWSVGLAGGKGAKGERGNADFVDGVHTRTLLQEGPELQKEFVVLRRVFLGLVVQPAGRLKGVGLGMGMGGTTTARR